MAGKWDVGVVAELVPGLQRAELVPYPHDLLTFFGLSYMENEPKAQLCCVEVEQLLGNLVVRSCFKIAPRVTVHLSKAVA